VEKGARVAEGGGAFVHHNNVQEHGRRHGAARWRSPARRWRSRPGSLRLSLSALLLIDRRKQRLIGLSPYACRAGYDTAARFLLIRAQYSALEKILKYTKYGRRRRRVNFRMIIIYVNVSSYKNSNHEWT
jgi:hypothetical protein